MRRTLRLGGGAGFAGDRLDAAVDLARHGALDWLVLECLADGESNKSIGRRFSVAEETIKTHLKNLYEKLGASDRAHAVAIALRQRLIE